MATITLHQLIADQTAARYPGIPSTTDGSGAVVWVESHISQAAVAYPITPSTPMGVGFAAEFFPMAKKKFGVSHWNFWSPSRSTVPLLRAKVSPDAVGRVTNFTAGQG